MNCRNPFSRPIYAVPEIGDLGVHLSIDHQGQARFGHDVEWVEALEYTVAMGRRRRFHEAIRRFWPNCREDRLDPTYAGIRPKLGSAGRLSEDFVTQFTDEYGVAGFNNLFGIELPGLISSLAIADEVMVRLGLDELEDK